MYHSVSQGSETNTWSTINVQGRSTMKSEAHSRDRFGRVRDHAPNTSHEPGKFGHISCRVKLESGICGWKTSSELSMTLHRADRHLIYPEGGIAELERIDPLMEEERLERSRKERRKNGYDAERESSSSSTIPGLNIQLNTPELVEKWIAERRKRWPTVAVIEQKNKASWDDPVKSKKNERTSTTDPPPIKGLRSTSEEEDTDSSSSDSNEDNSSESDVDQIRDAVSSKIPPPEILQQNPPVCHFFQRGTCKKGSSCLHSHQASPGQQASQGPKRKRPRATSPNPFDAPNLLRALLRHEISQHVNFVAQIIRFLVRNEFLAHYERKAGDAAEQKRRRNLIQEVQESDEGSHISEKVSSTLPSEQIASPLAEGALPVLNKALFKPPSPMLKALDELALPPEPDEFVLMDPLRANDVKPLTHPQILQIACDEGVRSLLQEDNINNKVSRGLMRALSTLDALPTNAHRSSAIEMILGVSEQSPTHAHQLGPTYVRPDRSANGSGSRIIGENELFRLGLRVGPQEIHKIRQLAARISSVIGGPNFSHAPDAEDSMQPWWDEKTRHEMRQKQWAKDADWKDKMRKLGIDVD